MRWSTDVHKRRTGNTMAMANRKKDKRPTKHFTENNLLDNNIPPAHFPGLI
jgi:hypothetical protein